MGFLTNVGLFIHALHVILLFITGSIAQENVSPPPLKFYMPQCRDSDSIAKNPRTLEDILLEKPLQISGRLEKQDPREKPRFATVSIEPVYSLYPMPMSMQEESVPESECRPPNLKTCILEGGILDFSNEITDFISWNLTSIKFKCRNGVQLPNGTIDVVFNVDPFNQLSKECMVMTKRCELNMEKPEIQIEPTHPGIKPQVQPTESGMMKQQIQPTMKYPRRKRSLPENSDATATSAQSGMGNLSALGIPTGLGVPTGLESMKKMVEDSMKMMPTHPETQMKPACRVFANPFDPFFPGMSGYIWTRNSHMGMVLSKFNGMDGSYKKVSYMEEMKVAKLALLTDYYEMKSRKDESFCEGDHGKPKYFSIPEEAKDPNTLTDEIGKEMKDDENKAGENMKKLSKFVAKAQICSSKNPMELIGIPNAIGCSFKKGFIKSLIGDFAEKKDEDHHHGKRAKRQTSGDTTVKPETLYNKQSNTQDLYGKPDGMRGMMPEEDKMDHSKVKAQICVQNLVRRAAKNLIKDRMDISMPNKTADDDEEMGNTRPYDSYNKGMTRPPNMVDDDDEEDEMKMEYGKTSHHSMDRKRKYHQMDWECLSDKMDEKVSKFLNTCSINDHGLIPIEDKAKLLIQFSKMKYPSDLEWLEMLINTTIKFKFGGRKARRIHYKWKHFINKIMDDAAPKCSAPGKELFKFICGMNVTELCWVHALGESYHHALEKRKPMSWLKLYSAKIVKLHGFEDERDYEYCYTSQSDLSREWLQIIMRDLNNENVTKFIIKMIKEMPNPEDTDKEGIMEWFYSKEDEIYNDNNSVENADFYLKKLLEATTVQRLWIRRVLSDFENYKPTDPKMKGKEFLHDRLSKPNEEIDVTLIIDHWNIIMEVLDKIRSNKLKKDMTEIIEIIKKKTEDQKKDQKAPLQNIFRKKFGGMIVDWVFIDLAYALSEMRNRELDWFVQLLHNNLTEKANKFLGHLLIDFLPDDVSEHDTTPEIIDIPKPSDECESFIYGREFMKKKEEMDDMFEFMVHGGFNNHVKKKRERLEYEDIKCNTEDVHNMKAELKGDGVCGENDMVIMPMFYWINDKDGIYQGVALDPEGEKFTSQKRGTCGCKSCKGKHKGFGGMMSMMSTAGWGMEDRKFGKYNDLYDRSDKFNKFDRDDMDDDHDFHMEKFGKYGKKDSWHGPKDQHHWDDYHWSHWSQSVWKWELCTPSFRSRKESKSCWMKDGDHEKDKKISDRIPDKCTEKLNKQSLTVLHAILMRIRQIVTVEFGMEYGDEFKNAGQSIGDDSNAQVNLADVLKKLFLRLEEIPFESHTEIKLKKLFQFLNPFCGHGMKRKT